MGNANKGNPEKKLSQIKESNSNAHNQSSLVSNPQKYVSAVRAGEILDDSEIEIGHSDEDSVNADDNQKS